MYYKGRLLRRSAKEENILRQTTEHFQYVTNFASR